MIRRLFLVVLLSIVVISASRTIPPAYSTIQKSCSQAHQAWITDILQRMETIKPGMTRAELLAQSSKNFPIPRPGVRTQQLEKVR